MRGVVELSTGGVEILRVKAVDYYAQPLWHKVSGWVGEILINSRDLQAGCAGCVTTHALQKNACLGAVGSAWPQVTGTALCSALASGSRNAGRSCKLGKKRSG